MNIMTDKTSLEQFIGIETDPIVHSIERLAVLNFCSAINSSFDKSLFQLSNTAKRLQPMVPPTFFRSLEANPLPFTFPGKRLLDAGSQWQYFCDTNIGDLITVTQSLQSIQEKEGKLGKMIFLTIQIKYINQNKDLAATQTSTLISY